MDEENRLFEAGHHEAIAGLALPPLPTSSKADEKAIAAIDKWFDQVIAAYTRMGRRES